MDDLALMFGIKIREYQVADILEKQGFESFDIDAYSHGCEIMIPGDVYQFANKCWIVAPVDNITHIDEDVTTLDWLKWKSLGMVEDMVNPKLYDFCVIYGFDYDPDWYLVRSRD